MQNGADLFRFLSPGDKLKGQDQALTLQPTQVTEDQQAFNACNLCLDGTKSRAELPPNTRTYPPGSILGRDWEGLKAA